MSHDELEREHVLGAVVAVVEAIAAGVLLALAASTAMSATVAAVATAGLAVLMLALAGQILDSVVCAASESWRCRDCKDELDWLTFHGLVSDDDPVDVEVEDTHPDAGGGSA